MYGSPRHWQDIYKANRDKLSSPKALIPGQVLKIP
jgi:nucleoid-associated protein YgaU